MKAAQRRTRMTAAQLDARAEAIAVRLLVARARALAAFDGSTGHGSVDNLARRAPASHQSLAQSARSH